MRYFLFSLTVRTTPIILAEVWLSWLSLFHVPLSARWSSWLAAHYASRHPLSQTSSAKVLLAVSFTPGVTGLNPIWTNLPQITQLCSMCCSEETTAKLVYCDSSLPVTVVAMQFLFLPGQKKYGATMKALTTVNKHTPRRRTDYRLSSLLRLIS